jgi:predicted nucleic acid-binding protein
MLVDTDVLIFNQRGNVAAADWLDRQPHFSVSAVTWMELVQGVRNGDELRALRRALRYWRAEVQPINEEITSRAVYWLEAFSLSHGLRMADALIAATAWYLGCPLATANVRHYRFIDEIELHTFRP